MRRSTAFLIITGLMFLALCVVFVSFPRSTFSELERRELATFPEFSLGRLASGDFTREVSAWFSDSEPYRDKFMQLHQTVRKGMALRRSGEDQVTFHAAEDAPAVEEPTAEELESRNRNIADYKNELTANANAKVAHAGIVITGDEGKVRALMAYGGEAGGGVQFAEMVNRYKRTFGPKVNVYCMVVPTSIEFYCPEKVKSRAKSQSATIRNIYAHLDDSVKAVDVYTTLGRHAAEPIYLRTDHHWSPLGAYYAARKFAQVARVPFLDIKAYRAIKIPGFVGTMYGYSKDISVKNSPEDFIYFEPRDTAYKATFVNYELSKDYKVVGKSAPHQAPFFRKFSAKGMSYSTFMGGDAMLVKVETGRKTGRRLAIIKDSFGNALPSNLFGSFDEVHVLDFRYFPQNIAKYVADNGITDFLIVNNIFNAYSTGVANSFCKLLEN